MRVYAVEPSPANFRTLVWNIRRYGLEDRIIPSHAALAGTTGRATLNLLGSEADTLRNDSPKMPDGSRPAVEVPTYSAVDLFARLGLDKVEVLKLDCETCEWSLDWAWLEAHASALYAELHAFHCAHYIASVYPEDGWRVVDEYRRWTCEDWHAWNDGKRQAG